MAKLQGTILASKIVPTDSLDTYATHDDKYGRGGHRSVDTLEERDNITTPRRKEGMTVYVKENKTKYILESGIENANWKIDSSGGCSGGDVDLSDYYKKTETYSKVEVDTKIADIPPTDLSGYYNKTETETLLSNKIDKGVVVVGDTKTKVTYNSDGIITGGADLEEADLPDISQAKITNLVSDLSSKQDTLVSGETIKTINNKSILGSGDIVIEQSIEASTLTEGQLDYLRDKQIKYGSWRCENIPSASYTKPSQKLPFFITKRDGQLTSQNETDFLFKKGVYYSVDTSYSIITTNGAILAISLVNTVNNAIIGDCYKTTRINVSGANHEINGSRIFTVNEDTVGSFKITYLSTSPLTVTLSEIKVNITEISSFDVSLKNFKINGKSFDENNNIDLEGLSTLSNPKLNKEVLTERRHVTNGKPIYVKTIDFGALPNSTVKNVPHTITGYDYIGIDAMNTYTYIPGVAGFSFSGVASVWNSKMYDFGMYIDGSDISLATGTNRTNMKAYVTVEYTKTTDTAQSPVRLVGGGLDPDKDIELTAGKGVIMTSANGTKYKLYIDNDGRITTEVV